MEGPPTVVVPDHTSGFPPPVPSTSGTATRHTHGPTCTVTKKHAHLLSTGQTEWLSTPNVTGH